MGIIALLAMAVALAGPPGPATGPPDPDPSASFRAYAESLSVTPHPEAGYRFRAEVYRDLLPLLERYPGRIAPELLGHSVRGEPIWALHVRDPTTEPTRKLLVFAQIHALEWITTEVAVAFIEQMVRRPPPGVAITVVPVLNVDGRLKVEADLRNGDDLYRRGNSPNVDLNRDFAVNREARAVWRHLLPRRYVTSPAPLSQPESQVLDALADRERFDVAVSLHAWGGYFYYPWAGRWERPADRAAFEALGRVTRPPPDPGVRPAGLLPGNAPLRL